MSEATLWHEACIRDATAMAYVSHVTTAVPHHVIEQENAAGAVSAAMGLPEGRSAAIRDLFRRAAVQRRHSVMTTDMLARPRGLTQNMELYRKHAVELGTRAAQACLEMAGLARSEIDMLVTCSCTGLLLPSLSVLISQRLGLRNDVRRIPLTETGCAGGAVALARADEFVRATPGGRALVVAVELPTLTLQTADHSGANLAASAFFGDGSAAAIVTESAPPPGTRGAEILATHSALVPGSVDDLGFDLRDGGMHIVLSREVPGLIEEHLPRVVDDFLKGRGLSRNDLSFFVVHPGGRKILDSVEACLKLGDHDVDVSRSVLRNFGNQSSAAVLFVLEQSLARGLPSGPGLLAAFGPGITVELSLLQGRTC